jgi:hypothetical protein
MTTINMLAIADVAEKVGIPRTTAIERILEGYELHKEKYGSLKLMIGTTQYDAKMRERYEFVKAYVMQVKDLHWNPAQGDIL